MQLPVNNVSAAGNHSVSQVDTCDLQGIYRGQKVRLRESIPGGVQDFELGEPPNDDPLSGSDSERARGSADSRKAAQRLRTKAVQSMADFEESGGGGGFQRFISILRRLRRSKDYGRAREEVESCFFEVSHQHAALLAAAELNDEDGGDPDFSQALREMAAELLEEKGPEIRASYNVSAVAMRQPDASSQKLQGFRDFYRRAVFNYTSPGEAYGFIMENYPTGRERGVPNDASRQTLRLEHATRYLRESLDAELHSLEPSQEPAYLKAVMDGIYQVEFLGNIHRSCQGLLEKFQKQYDPQIEVNPYRLVSCLLETSTKPQAPDDEFLNVAWSFRVPPMEKTINFLTQLHEISRQLPLKVFPNDEARARLLDGIQHGLDIAIREEEEALEQP